VAAPEKANKLPLIKGNKQYPARNNTKDKHKSSNKEEGRRNAGPLLGCFIYPSANSNSLSIKLMKISFYRKRQVYFSEYFQKFFESFAFLALLLTKYPLICISFLHTSKE
jgi:hypothetical protein